MKRLQRIGIFLLAPIAFGSAAPSNAAAPKNSGGLDEYSYSRRFEKVYEADPRAVFALSTEFGDAVVGCWDQNRIRIVADIRVDARDEAKAAEYGEGIQIEVVPSADRIAVKTVYPERKRSRSGLSFSVDYTITLPARQAAELRNAYGRISVSGLQGTLAAHNLLGDLDVKTCSNVSMLKNTFGSIQVEDIGGKAIAAENTNGDITGKTIRNGIRVDNRFGKVELEDVQGDLTVQNANGDITVSRVSGTADLADQFGSIRLTGVEGRVKVRSGNGSVEVRNVWGGEIRSSFGSIRVADATRADIGIEVENTNGEVFVEAIKGNANLSTGFGLIEATNVTGSVTASAQNSSIQILDPGGAVDAYNSFGPVTVRGTRSDVKIRNQNGSIECVVAKTGKSISLGSSFGSIKLVLPGDLSASFRAETTFGAIECDFPLKATQTDVRSSVEGSVNQGESKIEVTNQNGDVRIRKDGSQK